MKNRRSKRDTRHRRELGITLTKELIRKLQTAAMEHDLDHGGHYDPRSGCINLWCSPEDRPACWDVEITQGGLDYPRSFVGDLTWTWNDPIDSATLSIEATPFDLLDAARSPHVELDEETWTELLRWLEEKARWLLSIQEEQPAIVGTHCPFCDYVLPYGQLLNDLLEHILQCHPHEKVQSVTMGRGLEIATQNDTYPLQNAEEE